MAENINLKVDELNFQLIKDNLKQYLSTQDQFRDYNFEGSGLNVLLDILAYNTYYNSFYLNMIAGESFLSTAQKRNSVVALAKSLNYTPRSITSARVTGTITATPVGSPSFVSIPKNTEFTASINNRTFTFLTTEAKTLFSTESYRDTVDLIEGNLITRRYVVSSTDLDQRFIIPNTNVDTSSLSVRVLNSVTDSTSRTFVRSDSLIEVTGESQVFFLEEIEDGQFEVKFGNGIFGVQLSSGNLVVLEYIVSNGNLANDIQNLTYNDSITDITTISFSASSPSSGGNDRESISDIKFNAPKTYEAQGRIVTSEDYKSLLLTQSIVDSVSVWGGEDNDPPTYGKVFISIKPTTGEVLTATEKQNLITSVINPKKILTVSSEIVDPDYIYLLISCIVKYESDKTVLNPDDIKNLAIQTIQNYNDDEINQFSKYFRYSKLSRLIDTSERSILNNILDIRMRKEINLQLGISARYDINFSNAVNSATLGRPSNHPYGIGNQITSNAFTIAGLSNCFLEDNNGIIRIYRIVGNENIGVSINTGTIDYSTGKIILRNFAPTAFADGGTSLKITAIPRDKDILPLRNQIIRIRDDDISVSTIDDKTISLVNR